MREPGQASAAETVAMLTTDNLLDALWVRSALSFFRERLKDQENLHQMLFCISLAPTDSTGKNVRSRVVTLDEFMNPEGMDASAAPGGPDIEANQQQEQQQSEQEADVAIEIGELNFQQEESYVQQAPAGESAHLNAVYSMLRPVGQHAMWFRVCVPSPSQSHVIAGARPPPSGSLGIVEAHVLMADAAKSEIRVALEAPDSTSADACLLDALQLSRGMLASLKAWSPHEDMMVHHLALPLPPARRQACESAATFLLKCGAHGLDSGEFASITDASAAVHLESLLFLEESNIC